MQGCSSPHLVAEAQVVHQQRLINVVHNQLCLVSLLVLKLVLVIQESAEAGLDLRRLGAVGGVCMQELLRAGTALLLCGCCCCLWLPGAIRPRNRPRARTKRVMCASVSVDWRRKGCMALGWILCGVCGSACSAARAVAAGARGIMSKVIYVVKQTYRGHAQRGRAPSDMLGSSEGGLARHGHTDDRTPAPSDNPAIQCCREPLLGQQSALHHLLVLDRSGTKAVCGEGGM